MTDPKTRPEDHTWSDVDLALDIATRVTGQVPREARRFTTGLRHFVFEIVFAHHAPVVVRLGDASAHAEMAGGLRLSRLLRPRNVPLPEILAADIGASRPWLVLERLPGHDLGAVMQGLSGPQLQAIAAGVAQAQALTAMTASAGRYGYAAHPDQAPHANWNDVLVASLERSRARIFAAKLFDRALVEAMQAALDTSRAKTGAIEAVPFLHDTTTKNVIVAPDGHLSGIVDVDDLCYGDPRYPAALTLASMLANGGPTDYVMAWLRHAGARDDGLFRLYVALFLLDLMAEQGQIFNGNEVPSTPQGRAVLTQAFADNLERATS